MSETRLIALVLGAILIVAVLAYNAWRLRAYRPLQPPDGKLPEASPPVTMPPVAPGHAAAHASHKSAATANALKGSMVDELLPTADVVGQRREPDMGDLSIVAVDETIEASPIPEALAQEGIASDNVSAEIDSIATIVFDRDLTVLDLEPLLGLLAPLRKTTLIGALVEGRWQTPHARFREVRAALQLADRQGPIDDNDLAHFRQAVSRFALALQGRVDFENDGEAVARAARLDRQCAETDIEVVINVMDELGHGIARTAVQRCARSFNLTEAGERYLALGPDGRTVYELRIERLDAPASGIRASLAIDVSQVDAGHDAWAEMVATARALAAQVGGRLVDDGGQPLNESGLDALARTIATLQQRMRGMGVAPGSSLAARLYT
jgi:ZipA, C-terminal FtsZ-binding domain